MLNLKTLKQYFKATAKIVGINEFRHGWISSLNEDVGYDLMLLTPPKNIKKQGDRSYKYYDIKFYILNLDNDFTEEQRDDIWTTLEYKADKFLDKILENKTDFAMVGERVIEYDEDSINNDDCIWVECNVQLRVLSCGVPTEIPIP